MNTALLVLFGPSPVDVERLRDLIDSVTRYEPAIRYCLVIDDAQDARTIETAPRGRRGLQIDVLRHPRRGAASSRHGALITGVLSGLARLATIPGLDFVLKIDLDALVIAPFRDRVSRFLQEHPDAGVVGCRGETCDRAHDLYLACLNRPSPFAQALEQLDMFPPEYWTESRFVPVDHAARYFKVMPEQYAALRRIRPWLERAVASGHRAADYCQGGAYAISGTLIRRMDGCGAFDRIMQWLPLPFFGEDEVVAMHYYIAGLRLYDYPAPEEPFGISWQGLPFSPEDLQSRNSPSSTV